MVDESITVVVADEHLGDVRRVAEQLRAAGMHVDQVLDAVGIITGRVAPQRRAALEQLSGVDTIEAEQRFQIAPPDAEVQ